MRLGDTVQSNYFKVADIPNHQVGGSVNLTITGASMGKFDDGRDTLDLTFLETPKSLGCNITNRKRLMLMFGEDIELTALPGRLVCAYAEMTQTKAGDPCWGVRLRACAPAGSPVAPNLGATPSDVPPTPVQTEPHHFTQEQPPPPADADDIPF